ncbi:MAG TPA: hypothetical protein VEX36_04755 [Thermoleophilaceae bacterium]|nr:hypothetical protein [Thermoleophilaceae bacterium]
MACSQHAAGRGRVHSHFGRGRSRSQVLRAAGVLFAACALAGPATASAATPVGSVLEGATQSVTATATAVGEQTDAVAPGVGQAAATTVEQVTSAPAVRTVVETASEPLDRVAAGVEERSAAVGGVARETVDGAASRVPSAGAVETAVGCLPACSSPSASSRRGAAPRSGDGARLDGRGPRSDGAIDRRAARRDGGAGASGTLRVGDGLTAWSPLRSGVDATAAIVSAAEPHAAASPANADSSDDGEPGNGNPLFGPPATGGSAAPVGLTLLAFAVLVGLLGVALRRVAQPLHMSPSRRGLAAILTPIERPG